MQIGMLGAGHVAQAVAGHAVSAGHQVVLSNRRGPASLAPALEHLGPLASAGTPDEAAHAELVLLAVWWTQIPDAIAATGVTDWQGRIVIDTTNEYVGTPPDDITTGWLGENDFAATPAAAYGIVLLAAGLAYLALQAAIIHLQGEGSRLALAIGRDLKGKVSTLLYALGIGLAFVNRWLLIAIYVTAALLWLIPDRRLERTVAAAPRR